MKLKSILLQSTNFLGSRCSTFGFICYKPWFEKVYTSFPIKSWFETQNHVLTQSNQIIVLVNVVLVFNFPRPTCSLVSLQSPQSLPSSLVSHYRFQLPLQLQTRYPSLEQPCQKQHGLHPTYKFAMKLITWIVMMAY